MPTTLRINEIFHSIQGESTWAGLPCVFIRLTGCHLRCAYCDTEYAFYEGNHLTLEDICKQVQSLSPGGDLVEVTGGEPLLQPGVHELLTRLCDAGKTVLLETSGACNLAGCDPRVIRIMDLKTPGSGEVHRNQWSNLQHLHDRDEIKFVLGSRDDYDWARQRITEHRLDQRVHAVLLSAVHELPAGKEIVGMQGLSLRDLATWMLADQKSGDLPKTVRMQIQLHKLIWDPQTRGV